MGEGEGLGEENCGEGEGEDEKGEKGVRLLWGESLGMVRKRWQRHRWKREG